MPPASPVTPPGRLWLVVTLIALAIGVAQIVRPLSGADGLIDATGHMIGRDFVNVWTAGRLVLEGRLDILPDISAYQAAQRALVGESLAPHVWSYPPVLLPFTVPFGALPYAVALALWTLGGLALMFWTCARAGVDRRWMALLAIAPATFTNLWFGQNGFLTAALLLGGLTALNARPVLAGCLFGLLVYKPHLGILLPLALLAIGAWRAIFAAAATAILLVLTSVLLFGLEPWIDYLGKTAPYQRFLLEEGRGLFTYMMPTAFMAGRMLGLPIAACWAIAAVTAALAAWLVWLVFRAGRAMPDDPVARDLRYAVLLICIVLASPYALNYDLTLVAVAVALAARRGDSAAPSLALLLAWALAILVFWFNVLGAPISALVMAGVGLAIALQHQSLIRERSRVPIDRAIAAGGPAD